jgi:hypothetical protein
MKFKNIGINILLGLIFLFPSVYITVHHLHHHHEHFHCDATGNQYHFHSIHDNCTICDYYSNIQYELDIDTDSSVDFSFVSKKYYLSTSNVVFKVLFYKNLRAPPIS